MEFKIGILFKMDEYQKASRFIVTLCMAQQSH